MSTLERLSTIVAELLRDNVRRVLVGEDVRQGGMLGLSRAAMRDPGLAARVLATPLTPAASLAHATGLALAGRRPIVALASATALLEGYAALRELGRIAATSAGERSAPVLIVAPTGPGFGLGGDGAASPDGAIAGVPGLRVAILGDAREAGAMLRAAANFEAGEDPTVLLLPRALLLREVEDGEVVETLGRPLTAARCVREGAAATVFAWGAAVDVACAAAEQSGHDAAVYELGGLAPLERRGAGRGGGEDREAGDRARRRAVFRARCRAGGDLRRPGDPPPRRADRARRRARGAAGPRGRDVGLAERRSARRCHPPSRDLLIRSRSLHARVQAAGDRRRRGGG
ncbi:hypothetical protein [Nannocystis pusilla]|uniref:hypothetical protein n=1 Tax=Nannocystis pusilla TaxID=889268 RepID=UPI003DA1CB32